MNEVMIIGVVMAVLLLIMLWIVVSMYVKCRPNEAIIVSGFAVGTDQSRAFKVIVNGSTVVLPLLQQINRISLAVETTKLHLSSVYTKDHVPVSVDAVIQFKISANEVDIVVAAENLLGKTPEEVNQIVINVIERPLIALIEARTLNELSGGYDALSQELVEHSVEGLGKVGMKAVSVTVKSVNEVYSSAPKN